jgi:hypothetical protein
MPLYLEVGLGILIGGLLLALTVATFVTIIHVAANIKRNRQIGFRWNYKLMRS